MKRYSIALFTVFLPTTFYSTVYGQELSPIQTESPFTVPAHHFQIENEINYEKTDSECESYFYPTIFWKYGINEKIELRLITEFGAIQESKNNNTGINPVKIGIKTKLWDEKGIIPLTSFIGHLSIPLLATKNFRTTYYAPSFRFTMQHTITDKINLGYNLGAEWDGESPKPTFLYTLTIGLGITEKLGTYIEAHGFDTQEDTANHQVVGGISYYIKPNILVDFSLGCELTNNPPKYYSTLGLSIHLPV